jgi:pimeloyl-ACP methyl ester carboxylesterase
MTWVVAALLFQEADLERWLRGDRSVRAALQGFPLEAVEAALRKPSPRPAPEKRGEVVRRRLKAAHPKGAEFEYLLWIPVEEGPGRLILSLHGQGGTGEGALRNWLEDVKRTPNTYLLCPSAGRGGWGRSLLGHQHVLGPLRDVLAAYPIDPDLVFIDGASMGGNGSFEFACRYADLFAGAAPRSGGPMFRYLAPAPGSKDRGVTAEGLENLLATPLYWVVGAKDPKLPYEWVKTGRAQMEALKSDFTYREYPEGGHEWYPQENSRVLEWMSGKRRDAYPARVGVETQERAFGRNFWLEVVQFKGQENLKRNYTDLDQQPIEERMLFAEAVKVRAELVKEQNLVTVASTGPAKELRIHLHPSMLDLTKPVKVSVNGRTTTHAPKPSLDALLESAKRDRGLLYSASLTAGVP